MAYKGLNIIPKTEVFDQNSLSLVYTPGVGSSCLAIKDNVEASFIYTNRLNSVAVLSDSYEKSLKRAIFLKDTLLIDAYPLCISEITRENLEFVVNNIEPSFNAIDLSQIEINTADLNFEVKIPVLTKPVPDLKEFFRCIARTAFMPSIEKFEGSIQEKSLQLHEFFGGVLETELSEEETRKPVAVLSDGSAVLGFGNIGAEAGLPVMEGKAVLFKTLGGVNAMPLCVKTQEPDEIVKLVLLLENSFSGINLEDISAPRCFKIENTLKKKSKIIIFHDDQHGTAIVVLAGLLNALSLAGKKIEDVKIVFSGAGAAAQAVCRLFLKTGFRNITLNDREGAVFEGRGKNDKYLEEIAKITNQEKIEGSLSDTVKGADVFVGLSAPDVLTAEMIKSMAEKPIIFALANPVPEILPEKAKEAGAFIVATGRSDFPNQVNNSLAFPGLFKGALEANLTKITDEMKIDCAYAIASLVSDEELSPEKIIPNALDFRVPEIIAKNIAG